MTLVLGPACQTKETEAKPGTDPNTGRFDTSGDKDAAAPRPCVKDPSFYDVPGDNCDNDADGTVDNPETCDDTVDESAEGFARGLGICAKASVKGYGLVSAKFTRGFNRTDEPMPEQHSLLTKFGNTIKPREGKHLGVLSTGFAQEFDGADGALFSDGRDWWGADPIKGNGTAPPGFPKGAEGCPQATAVNDVIDLRLELKSPKNSSGFAFDFNFYSGEWPAFICSKFNDGFIAYVQAKSYKGGVGDNISFDVQNNPVSVNNGFFDRCTPDINLGCGSAVAGKSKCPGGPGELAGTGFGIMGDACGQGQISTRGGATGWLFSQAPIAAEEQFTIDFIIWDTQDGILDSSILLDHFRWILGDVVTTTDRPVDPK